MTETDWPKQQITSFCHSPFLLLPTAQKTTVMSSIWASHVMATYRNRTKPETAEKTLSWKYKAEPAWPQIFSVPPHQRWKPQNSLKQFLFWSCWGDTLINRRSNISDDSTHEKAALPSSMSFPLAPGPDLPHKLTAMHISRPHLFRK